MCEELISSSWEKNHMSNFSYTISIGQLGEQLTLNQWVLGSSPRWRTKKVPVERPGFFAAPSPAGRARTSRCALVFASRGPVAKNAPQERFLHAPADDAPGFSREGKRRRRSARGESGGGTQG